MSNDAWIVLSERGDTDAGWVALGLRERGLHVEHVTADALGSASRLEHRIGEDGVTTTVTLADGRVLDSPTTRAVVNRLEAVPTDQFADASIGDRAYAAHELHAFLVSWLSTLPVPVWNRPHHGGLGGPGFAASEWQCRAARGGFTVASYRLSTECATVAPPEPAAPADPQVTTLIVVGDRVAGNPTVPVSVRRAAVQLAQSVNAGLLGVHVRPSGDGDWSFVGATSHPRLQDGGAPLLDVMAETLAA